MVHIKLVNALQAKIGLAAEAVKFTEDAFSELVGAEKLENAKKSLIERLNGYGVGVTENKADTLIRSAYQTINATIMRDTGMVTAKD